VEKVAVTPKENEEEKAALKVKIVMFYLKLYHYQNKMYTIKYAYQDRIK